MRYVTCRHESRVTWGTVTGERVTLAPANAPASLLELIRSDAGASGSPTAEGATVALADVELLAPLPLPVEVIAIGVNYREHVDEASAKTGVAAPPAAPVVFSKASTSVTGPGAPILHDRRVTERLDWEVELGVVIGRTARDVSPDAALGHVFGYTVGNDVSARDVQFGEGGQWYRGKSFDSFCPLGPWIVTPDEFGEPGGHRIALRVNAVEKQLASTSDLIFDVPRLISILSTGRTLLPGTVILTGTPGGVGFGRTPPEFLAAGDVVEAEIEGIGVLSNPVVAVS